MLTTLAPYRETGYLILIEALERRGNVAEALRAYERLRVLLRDDLGIAPSPALQAVHRRLLTAPRPRDLGLREDVLAGDVADQFGVQQSMWSCAFPQSSSSLPPWMTNPHMQTILSATADLQINPLPSSRSVAESASTASTSPMCREGRFRAATDPGRQLRVAADRRVPWEDPRTGHRQEGSLRG